MIAIRLMLHSQKFPPSDFMAHTGESIDLCRHWLEVFGQKWLSPFRLTVIRAVLDYADKHFDNRLMNALTKRQRKEACRDILCAFNQSDNDFMDTVARACASIKSKNSQLRTVLQNSLNTLPMRIAPPGNPIPRPSAPLRTTALLPIAQHIRQPHVSFFSTCTGRSLLFGSAMASLTFFGSLREGNFLSAPVWATASMVSNTLLSLVAMLMLSEATPTRTAAIMGVTMLFYLFESGVGTAVNEGLVAGGVSLVTSLPLRR